MLTPHLMPELLGALPAALYTTDAEGRITYFNEAAAELWGRRPVLGDSRWCGSWRLFSPDGTPLPHDQCPMAIAIKEDRAMKGVEIIAERPDGSRLPLLVYPTPLHDSGRLVGAVSMVVDMSETKRAEEFTKQILESSQDCIKVLDLDGHLLSINACGIRALEVKDLGSALGARYLDFWQESDRKEAEAALQQALKGGVGRFIACFRTPSGVVTWWDEIITPILGAQGKPDKLLVISRDITETRAAAEQREVLIKELDHRVKNTLATVQSIANATLPASPALQAYLGRLQALAQAHRLLAETRWDGGCLETIITTVVSPYPEQVQVRGGGVRLSARAAQTMCMVMHELTTNAVKHGALSRKGGSVDISWTMQGKADERVLYLEWRETGGPPSRPPNDQGFGCKLIEQAVPFDLGGQTRLHFGSDGLECTIRLPLAGNIIRVREGPGNHEQPVGQGRVPSPLAQLLG
jgi:two-component system, chemotaxis family, CheB/CheR fusion protein